MGQAAAEDQAGGDHGLERGLFAHANLIVVILRAADQVARFWGMHLILRLYGLWAARHF